MRACIRVYVCACERACVSACVYVSVLAYVCVCARARTRARDRSSQLPSSAQFSIKHLILPILTGGAGPE